MYVLLSQTSSENKVPEEVKAGGVGSPYPDQAGTVHSLEREARRKEERRSPCTGHCPRIHAVVPEPHPDTHPSSTSQRGGEMKPLY